MTVFGALHRLAGRNSLDEERRVAATDVRAP